MKLFLLRRLSSATLLLTCLALVDLVSPGVPTISVAEKNAPVFKIGYLLSEYNLNDELDSAALSSSSSHAIANNSYYMTTSLLTTPRDYLSTNRFVCPEKTSALDAAVKFASKRLKALFKELYGCNLEIDRASTRVN
jgi:hypothetical protein